MDWTSGAFWFALLKIVWVNVLLSGDNAVVIALATRNLPPRTQKISVIGGSAAAIVLRVLLKVMTRFPIIVTMGAALIGYVAGEMAVTDPAIHEWYEAHMHGLDYAVASTCAVFVVAVGWLLSRRRARSQPA